MESRSRSFAEEKDETIREPDKKGSAKVSLMGSLGRLPDGRKVMTLNVDAPVKLGDLLSKMAKELGADFRRDSMLILVNGVEANALGEMDTMIQSLDDVVFLPMFHGGKC